MNTPPMRPEQLCPQLSPMAFSLDDPKNAAGAGSSSFQHLLASPTKFKLENGNHDPSSNNHIYRTSLSKLSEMSRSGRSRQRSNSDTLRSVSPIRFQLFNTGPKMLRQEYISQQHSASPLLSTLMKQSVTHSMNGSGATYTKDTVNSRVGVRETLEQIQREQELSHQRQEELKKKEMANQRRHPKSPKEQDTGSSSTSVENRKSSQTQCRSSAASSFEKQVAPGKALVGMTKNKVCSPSAKVPTDARLVSNTSTISSTLTVDLNDISKEMDIEMLTSDKIAFTTFEEPKSNRYSFISSSSTDYDGGDWCNNQPEPRSNHSEETARLDNRIKQLEIDIDNLKLQNEKLIQSITATRSVEDKFMLEALTDSRTSKQKAQQGMEKKVKQLEKKVESYKKAMQSCGDGSPELPIMIDTGMVDYKSLSAKRRITRISSGELRKIDEQSDSSGPSSEDEKDEQLFKHENYDDSTLTKELQRQQCSDQLSLKRKQGLQLNIPLQMQKTRK